MALDHSYRELCEKLFVQQPRRFSLKIIAMNIRQPQFQIKKWTNFGTNELWSARLSVGINNLLVGLCLDEAAEASFREALWHVTSELGSAFLALKKLRQLLSNNNYAVLDVGSAFSSVYDHLWNAYKDRFLGLAKSIGYDLVFMFKQDDVKFEAGLARFVASNPQLFAFLVDPLRKDRASWHRALKEERDNDQHKSERIQRGIIITTHEIYNLSDAHTLFDKVWQTIEIITVQLIAAKIEPPMLIVVMPEAERNSQCPVKFRVTLDLTDIDEQVSTTA